MKNQTKFRKIISIGAVFVFALSLTKCVTYVPIKSVRSPTINTTDVQRLAIRDFENKSGVGDSLGAQLTQYLTDQSRRIITNTGKFTIVAPNDPNADGVFSGEIRSITVNDSQEAKQRKDKEGNIIHYILYKRDVSLTFQYYVISSRTGMPVGSVSKNGSQSSTSEQLSLVTDPLTLTKRIVDSQLGTLQQDTVPTIVSTNRALMNETSKDKNVKQLMKMAQALVKSGNYEEAIRQYDQIDSEYGSVAARTNAGILRQAVSSDIAARTQLAELFSDKDGLAGKAAKGAINALNSKLPAGSNIIITKTRSTDRSRLDFAVNEMTKTIVQEGKLKVIERTNINLIEAEKQYQLSGNVDDDQIISIGHELGVQYIVLCWISGEMSARQLHLRVLDVGTAQVIDQSSFDI